MRVIVVIFVSLFVCRLPGGLIQLLQVYHTVITLSSDLRHIQPESSVFLSDYNGLRPTDLPTQGLDSDAIPKAAPFSRDGLYVIDGAAIVVENKQQPAVDLRGVNGMSTDGQNKIPAPLERMLDIILAYKPKSKKKKKRSKKKPASKSKPSH